MIIFYIIIIVYLLRQRRIHSSNISSYMSMLKSISVTLSTLILVYLCCLLPVVAGWGYWPSRAELSSYRTKAIFASIYWWLYGVNFFIFLATSSRIRAAYRRF